MKKITLLIAAVSFLLYRPYAMQEYGLLYKGDDETYFSQAASIAFCEFPSMEKELSNSPEHFIGAGIMAAPFVWAFSLLDRFTGSDIIKQRTAENVSASWSLFGFVFSSIFYFWMANLLLYRGVRAHFNEKHAVLTLALMVLIQGVPLYVYRRPVFSHGYEFFLQSLMVYLLLRTHREKSVWDNALFLPIFVGFLSGMVCLVRFNNALIALIWPIAILAAAESEDTTAEKIKHILVSYSVILVPIVIFLLIPLVTGKGGGEIRYIWQRALVYITGTGSVTARFLEPGRHVRVILGTDFGLLYTAPFLIVSSAYIFFMRNSLKNSILLCTLPLSVSYIYFVIASHSYGSWYGYRYFLFSAIPLFVLPMAELSTRLEKRFANASYWILGGIALFPFLSMLCFEGNPDGLTLHVSNLWSGWQNPVYQIEVWKTAIFHPISFLKSVLKGGTLYVVYLFAVFTNTTHLLPDIIRSKYPVFDIHVFIKSMIIYLAPFLFLSISVQSEKIKRTSWFRRTPTFGI